MNNGGEAIISTPISTMNDKENIILNRCMNFSVRIIKLRTYLTNEKHEYDISKQLLRSGTSIGANLNEAQAAVSKRDFISKAGISLKESRESLYWIELLSRAELINQTQYESLKQDCEEIIKLITSIIKTSKQNLASEEMIAKLKQ